MNHKHCTKCGNIIKKSIFVDWVGCPSGLCVKCKYAFAKEAVFMSMHRHLPSTQEYFKSKEE